LPEFHGRQHKKETQDFNEIHLSFLNKWFVLFSAQDRKSREVM